MDEPAGDVPEALRSVFPAVVRVAHGHATHPIRVAGPVANVSPAGNGAVFDDGLRKVGEKPANVVVVGAAHLVLLRATQHVLLPRRGCAAPLPPAEDTKDEEEGDQMPRYETRNHGQELEMYVLALAATQ